MLARLCLILSFSLAADSTLPNGIRVYDWPGSSSAGNSFEVVVGYRRYANFTAGAGGLDAVVASFLHSSPSARAMAVAAYGAGGEIEFVSELHRTGIRLKVPGWAKPMVEESIAEFLSVTPQKHPELVDRALAVTRSRTTSESDVRSRVEEQFQIAMKGPGSKFDLTGVTRNSIEEFFNRNYGTDRAFVLMNAAPGKSLQDLERRTSIAVSGETGLPGGNAVKVPRIETDQDTGAVILGAHVASVHYRGWYAILMLDRLIQQTVPQKPQTILIPSIDPYYYRMEVEVPSGKTADAVEASLRQSLDQLQYTRATDAQLEESRRSALQYLESDFVRQWFLTLGIPERRAEGVDWMRAFSADDMRSAARNLVESNPVIASWSPRPKTLRLDVESLSASAARAANAASGSVNPVPPLPVLGPVRLAPFPPHKDAEFVEQAPVRLESGVSLVASSGYAVFVAPGMLKTFDREPAPDMMQTEFGAFRSNRILVMAPLEALDRMKQQWNRFQGNIQDKTEVTITGNITSAYIPTVLVLKMLLDRRLIEAGMWNDIRLNIRASEDSALSIHGNEANRRLVLDWIREIASRPIPDSDMEWAREAATHHLPDFRPDMQSLIWKWSPDGTITDARFIPAAQVQDAARLYLQ